MADKTRAPRKFETLPADFDGVRFAATDHEKHLKFVKTELKKKQKDAPPRFALIPERPKKDEQWQELVDFGGPQLVGESFYRFTRAMAQRWTFKAFSKDEGIFVPDEFAKMVDKFSARGETLKALRAELDELQTEMIEISQDTTTDAAEKMKRFTEIVERMKEVKEAIDFNSATPEDDEDADDEPAQA